MTKIAQKLTDLIGRTPLLQLNTFSQEKQIETPIVAKVEYFNPGGSVKDRIALAMIEDAEKEDEQKAKEEEDNKKELESGLNDIIGGKTDVRTPERKEQEE